MWELEARTWCLGGGIEDGAQIPACQGEGKHSGGFIAFIGEHSLPFLSFRLAQCSVRFPGITPLSRKPGQACLMSSGRAGPRGGRRVHSPPPGPISSKSYWNIPSASTSLSPAVFPPRLFLFSFPLSHLPTPFFLIPGIPSPSSAPDCVLLIFQFLA